MTDDLERELVRIIARCAPWRAGPGARLRWDALTEAGEVLATGTEHPFSDGAHVLAERGLDPETLVTMRHEGAPHDSFKPLPLRVAAAVGAKRAEARANVASKRALHSGFIDHERFLRNKVAENGEGPLWRV